jgi:hypothetical protein
MIDWGKVPVELCERWIAALRERDEALIAAVKLRHEAADVERLAFIREQERDEARTWARQFLDHAAVVSTTPREVYEAECPWLKEQE